MDFARAGVITDAMRAVAEAEHRDPEFIRAGVAAGRIAIPANVRHLAAGLKPAGVGEGLSTKVNVNLGISGDIADAAVEWEKVASAEPWAPMPSWTSPTPERRASSASASERRRPWSAPCPCTTPSATWRSRSSSSREDLLATVRAHAEDGVDFLTIHCGINRSVIKTFREKRAAS